MYIDLIMKFRSSLNTSVMLLWYCYILAVINNKMTQSVKLVIFKLVQYKNQYENDLFILSPFLSDMSTSLPSLCSCLSNSAILILFISFWWFDSINNAYSTHTRLRNYVILNLQCHSRLKLNLKHGGVSQNHYFL